MIDRRVVWMDVEIELGMGKYFGWFLQLAGLLAIESLFHVCLLLPFGANKRVLRIF